MEGYLTEAGLDRSSLHGAWLDTGDLGYLRAGTLVVTGRRKDLLIVNGRNLWPQDLELTAERSAEGRTGDAAAFTVEGPEHDELVVLLQCRERDEDKRQVLLRTVRRAVQTAFGVEAQIHGVAPHALPRTTSGKLSRPKQQFFLDQDLSLDLAGASSETPNSDLLSGLSGPVAITGATGFIIEACQRLEPSRQVVRALSRQAIAGSWTR